jgi:regulatory protein
MSSKKAYSYLVRILSIRDFSEYKLREKLRERQYPADEIDEAISEVKAKNYLREDNYTEARIKAFMNKGYSPDFIQQKLKQEHLSVSDDVIQSVFEEYKITAELQIERLILKKMGCHNRSDFADYEKQTKILRYLLSKGHELSQSRKILKLMILS